MLRRLSVAAVLAVAACANPYAQTPDAAKPGYTPDGRYVGETCELCRLRCAPYEVTACQPHQMHGPTEVNCTCRVPNQPPQPAAQPAAPAVPQFQGIGIGASP